jgi:SAM-dependent methyltransferase
MSTTNIKQPNTTLKLSTEAQKMLNCPICRSQLIGLEEQIKCSNVECAKCFPSVDGTAILIDESSSIFSIEEYLECGEETNLKAKSKLERGMINLIPSNILNLNTQANYQQFTNLLLQRSDRPKVLVIGGGTVGQGAECLLSNPAIEIIETDVVLTSRIDIICDAHQLPFADNSFDGVIVQAVLEHVVDPFVCVEEIYRVLNGGGLVYSETPFMQQVHLGKYDFTRFTHLGHRRLFRKFEEVSSGGVCGPGMALNWSLQYFFLSFVKSPAARNIVKALTRLTFFWLKYFDYYLINKPGAFDSASAYYFLGRKNDKVLSDKELLKLYRGAQSSSF